MQAWLARSPQHSCTSRLADMLRNHALQLLCDCKTCLSPQQHANAYLAHDNTVAAEIKVDDDSCASKNCAAPGNSALQLVIMQLANPLHQR